MRLFENLIITWSLMGQQTAQAKEVYCVLKFMSCFIAELWWPEGSARRAPFSEKSMNHFSPGKNC